MMDEDTSPRDTITAMKRGLAGRCPKCGEGKMFRAFLKVADHCPHCAEELSHQRADDAPAYFVISIVGHIVVVAALVVETTYMPPLWVHSAMWIPLTVAMSVALLQPIKGAIVGWQWAMRMHGFGNPHDDPATFGITPRPAP